MRALLLALLLCPLFAGAWDGRCVGVTDGDTIKVLHDGVEERVRLASIDAPEKAQPFGQAAKKALSDLVFGKTVSVDVTGTDRYQRTLGTVSVDGMQVQQELLRQGMVWVYRKYSQDEQLLELEQEARDGKRGLWSQPEPVPPWEWRRAR